MTRARRALRGSAREARARLDTVTTREMHLLTREREGRRPRSERVSIRPACAGGREVRSRVPTYLVALTVVTVLSFGERVLCRRQSRGKHRSAAREGPTHAFDSHTHEDDTATTCGARREPRCSRLSQVHFRFRFRHEPNWGHEPVSYW